MRNNKRSNRKSIKVLLKLIVTLSALAAAGWLIFFGISNFLKTSSYFNIKRVIFIGLEDKEIADNIAQDYISENIFDCNLIQISRDIKLHFPQFHDLRIVRNFPDSLTVYIIQRRPIAQLHSRNREYFLIDNEGMIISRGSSSPYDKFIIIEGIKGVSSLRFGQKIIVNDLKKALELTAVTLANQNKLANLLNNFTLTSIAIDVSKFPTIVMKIANFELRFAEESYNDKINIFLKLLPTLKGKIEQVKYIDLRFSEPAISFQE